MNPMNILLLQPTDVLFFRDGRPMEGALAGHGAAWPLPNVTDAAFHAALHRSGLHGHAHDQWRDGTRSEKDVRQFGSLLTAGPFPVFTGSVNANSTASDSPQCWYFPRPLDLLDATLLPTLLPTDRFDPVGLSLPAPLLQYTVANRLPPRKDTRAKAWLSASAYRRYLEEEKNDTPVDENEACDDSAFTDAEATVGIALDAETGTTGQGDTSGKIYSARYLRLRDEWRLGVFAKTSEKNGSPDHHIDLIPQLINERQQLLVGGQQRICTAELLKDVPIPLPLGKRDGFQECQGKHRVKWILLSPAIWPKIPDKSKDGRPMMPHPGGWLPNWVRQQDGQVMLRDGKRQRRSYSEKHTRGFEDGSKPIPARLVAAIVPKAATVTGWALANDTDRELGGAKSTHLAVPAGAVYYFEADSAESAVALAAALNWHGDQSQPHNIQNRRSTLMGEKGFGLGVCGPWKFFGT